MFRYPIYFDLDFVEIYMQLPELFSTIFNHKIRTTIYGNETAVYCRCVKNDLFLNLKNLITDQHQENTWGKKRALNITFSHRNNLLI
jgi:hypothetical protein